jgi:3-methyladenine DNA glycosylase AlkD
MTKRELIEKNKVKKLLDEGWDRGVYPRNDIMCLPTLTEQEIVNPYLEKLKEQIAKSADKQLKIAMGTADLNDRYAHIRVESAFRQCIAMIDNLLSEQETWI